MTQWQRRSGSKGNARRAVAVPRLARPTNDWEEKQRTSTIHTSTHNYKTYHGSSPVYLRRTHSNTQYMAAPATANELCAPIW